MISDRFKQERYDEIKQQIADLNDEVKATIYHLIQVSDRRHAVIRCCAVQRPSEDDRPFRVYHAIPGLKRVDYITARAAVIDLNAGRTHEYDYQPPEDHP